LGKLRALEGRRKISFAFLVTGGSQKALAPGYSRLALL
jgi:hypothetical protein